MLKYSREAKYYVGNKRSDSLNPLMYYVNLDVKLYNPQMYILIYGHS